MSRPDGGLITPFCAVVGFIAPLTRMEGAEMDMGPSRATVRLGTLGAGFGLTEELGRGLAGNVADGEGGLVGVDVRVGVDVAVGDGVESTDVEPTAFGRACSVGDPQAWVITRTPTAASATPTVVVTR